MTMTHSLPSSNCPNAKDIILNNYKTEKSVQLPSVRKTVINDHVTQMHSTPLLFCFLRHAAFRSSTAEGEGSAHSYGKANTGLLSGRLVRW